MKKLRSIREFPSELHEAILVSLIPHGEQGAYGGDIKKSINRTYEKSGIKKLDMGSIYPAFKRMSEQGWIKGRWGEDNKDEESGGARRRYYYITADGKSILRELWAYRDNLRKDLNELEPALI